MIDPIRHLGCCCLGKGQAQEIFWIDARLQQQPENARAQYLRLARTCRRTEPHITIRRDRVDLRPGKIGQRAQLFTRHLCYPDDHTIRSIASDDHNPNTHIRDAAWL